MNKHKIFVVICFLLLGCASRPSPDWLNKSQDQLDNYKKSYLSGSEKIAAKQFQLATNEIKKSGDLDILSRAYLIRMALQVSALEEIAEEDYLRVDALQTSLKNHAFYSFLKGDINHIDGVLLPKQYRGFFVALKRSNSNELLQEVTAIEDPLSQLIAIGIVVRLHKEAEAILERGMAVASKEGWKKPLIAYMKRLQAYYENNKLTDKALEIQQTLTLISN
jgi:hypothetical protein